VNIANSITILRMFLAPVFLVLFMNDLYIWVLVVVILAEFSDLVDGHIARRYKIITNFGKLMDPYADSIYRFTVFLCFFAKDIAELWMVAIIFYRDVIVAIVRNFGVLSNVVIAARKSGKIKAIAQSTAINVIILIIVYKGFIDPKSAEPARAMTISYYLMLGATLVTLFSAVDYVLGNWHIISKYKK
jgi:CDP-diacylglycerol---glycerol-3-phosphate 3-phosphatidyltransferase